MSDAGGPPISSGQLSSMAGNMGAGSFNPANTAFKGLSGSVFTAAVGQMPGLIQGAIGSVNPGQHFSPKGVAHNVGQGGLVGVLGAKDSVGMAA